jgi:fibrillarin-like pre-rRNA processing protein
VRVGEKRAVEVNRASAIEKVFPGVYLVTDPKNANKKLLATANLTPGRVYYGEQTIRASSEGKALEFRLWDPFRSKLSASILRGLKTLPFAEGSACLYLGASTGTTVSHVSDIVCSSGRIFAVEMAPRVARELLEQVVRFRANIIPVIADARRPEKYPSIFGNVSIVYADIAQPDQTEIAVANCQRYLSRNGSLFLVVKASSIDALEDKGRVVSNQVKKLRDSGFEIDQEIDLEPYDKKHAMVISRYMPRPEKL